MGVYSADNLITGHRFLSKEYRPEVLHMLFGTAQNRVKIVLIKQLKFQLLVIWTISYGLALDNFSYYARGQLFTPVRILNQGGCDRQSQRSGQKCSSKSWEPGEKQAAGNRSV